MSSRKEAMDVDPTMYIPSDSSTDVMRMINNANRTATVPEKEQWTIRGSPKGLALFHKNKCQCCNDYVAHTIKACKEQGMDLPIQAVGDAVTKAWPILMRDLEDEGRERALRRYKGLVDEANRLRADLKASKAALIDERSRVEIRDKTIRDLRDEIAALKRPQSTSSSTRPTAPASSGAGLSSRQTAPLPARARSSLAARMTKPGLASRMEIPPGMDRFNDQSGVFANDVPDEDTSLPEGWEHNPNWDSDASVWDEMKGPGDSTEASGKKRKKRAPDSEPQSSSWLAAQEKATREYLAQSTSHTVVDKALKRELRMALRSFALLPAERAKNVVIPTPQFADLTVRPRYPGEGEPLPHGDPPIPVMGRLPRLLGRSVPRMAEWFDVCPLDDIQFQELHELAKLTPPAERTREMITTF
jgi:hypothetical protein